MKFAIDKSTWNYKDRAEILNREESSTYNPEYVRRVWYRPMIIVKVTCDWDEKDLFPIIDDTDSIQYRPKSIYVNNKGEYYYKNSQKKREYFTPIETKMLLDYMNTAKKYLETYGK